VNPDVFSCIRLRTASGALAVAALVSACATPPETASTGHVATPALELVAAGTLELPGGCEPVGGAVYRTRFMVREDGRVADTLSESGAGCVQQALERWVATFRYRPPGEAESAVVDWMSVTASRGGG
jgi:hypothetical protein